MNYYGAIKKLYPDIKDSEFTLYDEGDGVFIKHWTYSKPKPNLEDLTESAILEERRAQAINKRREEYPPIGDQLDAILKYLDTIEQVPAELQDIITRWKDVKTRYPL